MGIKVIQCNLNNCWRAHDLLDQQMLEIGAAICIVSEPREIPGSPYWFGSEDGKAAIRWDPGRLKGGCVLERKGRKLVVVRWGKIYIMACYISPNSERWEYLEFLDEVEEAIRDIGQGLVIGGDFNARSLRWDKDTNWRGDLVEEWAAGCNVDLENVGQIPTCMRPQGDSVVDLTWTTATESMRIDEWQVLEEVESGSDHRYISFRMNTGRTGTSETEKRRMRKTGNTGWNFRKMDKEVFDMSVSWSCAVRPVGEERGNARERAGWIDETIKQACDISTPKNKRTGPRKNAYWWNEEVKEVRRICIEWRRKWVRSKNKEEVCEDEALRIEKGYRTAKKALKTEIKKAKEEAWRELVQSVEDDPWGKPYRLVLGKLRRTESAITEKLKEEEAEKLLDELFPKDRERRGEVWKEGETEWREEWSVGIEEVQEAVKKGKRNTAPGLDGVVAKIWEKVPEEMIEEMRECFNKCLVEGIFPEKWKLARLVLIPKGVQEGNIKARPICLIKEIAKILERVIVQRIEEWMEKNPKAGLGKNQYGFRKGKSTMDALLRVTGAVKEAWDNGKVLVAVSLDVANAFNSIPRTQIGKALKRKGFPGYIRKILHNYLLERKVIYPIAEGKEGERIVEAGVPQGSVLGPTLWNITYDEVLGTEAEEGCEVIGYADDTMILATAERIEEATVKASMQVGKVMRKIRGIGLRVAIGKTEAVCFQKRKRREDRDRRHRIVVGNEEVELKDTLKYLGVILDEKLSFRQHLVYVEGKAIRVAKALSRLMPNLRGAGERKRKLYAGVVMAVVLYAAPVWSGALEATGAAPVAPGTEDGGAKCGIGVHDGVAHSGDATGEDAADNDHDRRKDEDL